LPVDWNVAPGALDGPESLHREMSARLPDMPE
jgi:hypothetical protein